MCGIIGIKNLKDNQSVNQAIRIIYENQKSRGRSGFGFIGLKKKHLQVFRSTYEKGILNYLEENNFDEIIFHHRNPTSTENNLPSTHPFVIDIPVKHKKYYIVHNGIISNDDELYAKHKKLGIKYQSESGYLFNDSEALSWEFALWLNGLIDDFEAKGLVGLIGLEIDRRSKKALKLYFYRNKGVSLKMLRTKDILVLSSGGEWNDVKANNVYYYDYKSKQIRKHKKLVIQDHYTYNYGKQPYASNYHGGGWNWEKFNQKEHGDKELVQPRLFKSPPAFADSRDEQILDSIPALKRQVKKLREEQNSLIVDGETNLASSLDIEIEEYEDLIQECNRYFDNPSKTDEERMDLLARITDLALGY